ncbi:hypothetical protein BN1723_000769 [Verticillium longisporum]|uniref:EH domain-containing protein n=1 Tax=Verticillium longisporum TaxID=100787 RepID=A0A0G4N7E6_VERLO|nr:hypothetical protein BN1723_000769 [Verticillium longisporum]
MSIIGESFTSDSSSGHLPASTVATSWSWKSRLDNVADKLEGLVISKQLHTVVETLATSLSNVLECGADLSKAPPLGIRTISHHEGARRRWREEMTPRERKRYEALWASNRGLLHDKMAPGPRAAAAADLVLNVVVREIWRRSRLPDDELGEVWDLVVGQSAGALPPGMLGKQEFVVGTWVVDQRLKGRKIPAKVGASVWDSAKGVRVWTPKAKEARRK